MKTSFILIALLFTLSQASALDEYKEQYVAVMYAKPGDTLIFIYTDEFGIQREKSCMAAFLSKTHYKLISPWERFPFYVERVNNIDVDYDIRAKK